jgi:hypothetical protein
MNANIFKLVYSISSNDRGQKQPIRYLFLSTIMARCKPVKGREENLWLDQESNPGPLHY